MVSCHCHLVPHIVLGMDPPTTITDSNIVFRDSVLIYALKDLDMLGAYIWNDSLNAPTSDNVYYIAGPQLGAEG